MTFFRAALLGSVIGAAALVGIKPANATFYVYYSLNGGGTYASMPGSPASDGTTISVSNGSIGSMSSFSSTFTNNAPNATATSTSFTNSTQINATSTTGGTITFAIVENDFQGPTSLPGTLTNSVTLIPNAGTMGSILSQYSCVLSGSATVTAGNVGGVCGTSTAITPTASVTDTGLGSFSSTTSTQVGALSTPFTTAEFFTLTLKANANVLAQGRTALSVPEPVSISVLGAGLVGIGLARRRSGKTA